MFTVIFGPARSGTTLLQQWLTNYFGLRCAGEVTDWQAWLSGNFPHWIPDTTRKVFVRERNYYEASKLTGNNLFEWNQLNLTSRRAVQAFLEGSTKVLPPYIGNKGIRFLLILRDGRDCVLSAAKLWGVNGLTVGTAGKDINHRLSTNVSDDKVLQLAELRADWKVETFARYWIMSCTLMSLLTQYYDCLPLRFESLVGDPQGTIGKIGKWLGRERLTLTAEQESAVLAVGAPVFSTGLVDGNRSILSAGKARTWRLLLEQNAEVVEYVESLLGPMLQLMEYGR